MHYNACIMAYKQGCTSVFQRGSHKSTWRFGLGLIPIQKYIYTKIIIYIYSIYNELMIVMIIILWHFIYLVFL